MHEVHTQTPEFTVALALLAGIMAQVIAHHIRLPGIVLLLAMGVLLGPDVLGLIDPSSLGPALGSLVGYAVAVILFEGGLNLDLGRLKRSRGPILRLITLGAAVTMLGATLAAKIAMGWDWGMSAVFGALVIVTGPTVVTPLLKRLKVEKETAAILEAEGVLIDAVGAITAFVTLELVLSSHHVLDFALTIPELLYTLGVGTGLGLVGGWLLSRVLGIKHFVPEDLTNVFTLAWVLAIFQISESLRHESGIAAVTIAGIVVAWSGVPVKRELQEFKEQLTVLFIGMLFVLLAADVRLDDISALGIPGIVTVAALIILVRPATVIISTAGSGLSWRQKAFMSWMGPRGIVAAAVASLFAMELEDQGVQGGRELRALVFLVIAVTVVLAGLSGGLVARVLGMRRPQNRGWVILGAHHLARTVASNLVRQGEEVLLIDVNPANCTLAERDGLRVIMGDALKESTMARLELDTRAGALGLTRNEEVNFLFSQKARRIGRVPRVWSALRNDSIGVGRAMLEHANVGMLFGVEQDVDRWNALLHADNARCETWRYDSKEPLTAEQIHTPGQTVATLIKRGRNLQIVDETSRFKKGDEVTLLVALQRYDFVVEELTGAGWVRVEQPEDVEEE